MDNEVQTNRFIFHGDAAKEQSVRIDGVRLADIGVHLLADSQEPMLPDVRSHTVTIPGRHGAYDFGAYFEPRPLTLSCGFNHQASFDHVQTLIRNLSAIFLDAYGRPREVSVEYDYERGKYYKAKLASGVDINRIVRAGLFSVPLVAYDPYAYSTFSSDEVTWGNEEITFEYSYLLGHEGTGGSVRITSPTTQNIYVDGYAVKPIFEISGRATRLTIATNGYSFELPTFNNETWTIDCDKYTVLRNGKNAFGDMSLGEFILHPGSNVVSFGGSGMDVNVRIKFRDKYM